MGEPEGMDDGADSDFCLCAKITRLDWRSDSGWCLRHHQLACDWNMGSYGRKNAPLVERSSAIENFQPCRCLFACGIALPNGCWAFCGLINEADWEKAALGLRLSACPIGQYTDGLGCSP